MGLSENGLLPIPMGYHYHYHTVFAVKIAAYPQIKLCHAATVSSSFFAAAMLLENLQLISLLVVTVGKRLRNSGRTSMYKWNCNPEVGEETSSLPIFFWQSGRPLP